MTPVRYLRNEFLLPVACLLVAACAEETPEAVKPDIPGCSADGYLTTALYGAIEAGIDWPAGNLTCEGMPRPEGEGARLRFSGPVLDAQDEHTVALIFGIPDLTEGATASELPTNVTLVQEGAGRFFGTRDTDGCWTDVTSHDLLAAETASYQISGKVYCVSPLAELNGNASVNFTELSFSGQIRWELPE